MRITVEFSAKSEVRNSINNAEDTMVSRIVKPPEPPQPRATVHLPAGDNGRPGMGGRARVGRFTRQ